MWDSSDPTRAPPPMPLYPDSPTLNTVPLGTGPVSGSPFKITSSPIKQSFASRNYSSINEDRLMEILEASRDIKVQNQMVEATVKDAMSEFGSLIHRSKDNGSTLSSLISLIENTRESVEKTGIVVKDKFPMIIGSLDTQREAQRSLTTVADVLLEQVRDFGRRLQLQESNIKKILQINDTQKGKSQGVTKEEIDRLVGRTASKVLEEFGQFSGTIGAQQQQTINLLLNLKEYFDKSGTDFDNLYTQIATMVREETIGASNELGKTIKKSADKTSEQLETLDADLRKVQDSLQASIAKAINNAATLSQPETPTHDHMIPEIANKLVVWEQQNKLQHDKARVELLDRLEAEFQEAAGTSKTDINLVLQRVDELVSAQATIASTKQVKLIVSKLDDLAESLETQYQQRLQQADAQVAEAAEKAEKVENESRAQVAEAEKKAGKAESESFARVAEAEKKTSTIESECRSRVAEAEKKVEQVKIESRAQLVEAERKLADMEARLKEMEIKMKQQEHGQVQAKQAAELETKRLIMASAQEADKKVSDLVQKLADSTAQKQSIEQNMKMLKYFNHDIDRHEEVIQGLEDKTAQLQQEKQALGEDVSSLKATYTLRVEKLKELETRVEGFERRLSQAILDRSKSILGTTTMAIINSAGEQKQTHLSKVMETERGASKGSPRRHLSLAPANFENMAKDLEDDYDKENDTIAVMKRGSPFMSKKQQQRSISMFADK